MRHMGILVMGCLFVVIALGFGTNINNMAYADDDDHYEHYREHEKDESPFEEIGKMVGWGTVISMGSAGLLFPMRRSTKTLVNKAPNAKSYIIQFNQFLGKRHVMIGILALVLSITHGITMFLSKGELELEGYIGIDSLLLMIIAAIFGSALIKNKKAKRTRTIHITFLAIALLIGVVHIII